MDSAVASGPGNHCDAAANEIGDKRRHLFVLPIEPVILDYYILAFDESGLGEPFAECCGPLRRHLA